MLKKGISISLSLLLAALVFVNPLLFSAQAEAPLKLTQNFESSFPVSGCEIVSDFATTATARCTLKTMCKTSGLSYFTAPALAATLPGCTFSKAKPTR